MDRDRERKYSVRTVAYDVVPKHNFIRGWFLSRSVMRERWNHPRGVYRTKIDDCLNRSIEFTIMEVLPGQFVHPHDPFLAQFVHYTEMCGFMAFDTERTEHPVMVQVLFHLIFVSLSYL